MSYRLLLFDLDGTLLDPQRRIAARNERTLRDLMAAGILVGFATGRSHISVARFVEVLEPNGPLILFNGTVLWDWSRARALQSSTLPRDSTIAALELAAEYTIHANLYIGDALLISHETDTSRASETKDGVPHTVVGELAPFFVGRREARRGPAHRIDRSRGEPAHCLRRLVASAAGGIQRRAAARASMNGCPLAYSAARPSISTASASWPVIRANRAAFCAVRRAAGKRPAAA